MLHESVLMTIHGLFDAGISWSRRGGIRDEAASGIESHGDAYGFALTCTPPHGRPVAGSCHR